MKYTSTLKKLLAMVLMVGILMTSSSFTVNAAEAAPQESAIEKAIDWLKVDQNGDGSWGINDTAFLATSEVSGYLTKYSALTDNLQKSTTWMEGLEIINNDIAARVLPLIKNEDKHTSLKNSLINSQNEDGGWGLAQGYESDVFDTALVLNALVSDTNTDLTVMQNAVSFLVNAQHSNGSWSFSGGDDSVISVTSQVALTLSLFQTKTNLTSSELQTAMRKAGEYLVSVQKPDKTWGTDENSITDTLLSYRAVLNTVGLDPVDTTDTSILSCQNSDGSWNGSPYITALAINAVKERMDMPYAKINSIKLVKNVDGTKTESYSYNAYESFEIQVDSTYSNIDAKLLYFVKQKDGSVVSAYTEGQPGWNTRNSLPGEYSVIVQVKDNITGRILTNAEKQFTINSTFKIGTVILKTDPQNTSVDKSANVNTEATLVTEANIDKTLNVKFTVLLNGSTIVKTETKDIICKAEDPVNILRFASFEPDTSTTKDYVVKVEVLDDINKIFDAETIFKVLPPPPPTRIDATQSINKSVLYPGTDSVTAQFKLIGEGTPEGPQRTPIDLVLILDNSGSMSGTPWTKTKDAAKTIADMIQPEDRCAVVGFGSSAWIQINLTSDKNLVKQSITNMPYYGGGTAMDAGIQKGFDIVSNVGSDRQKIFMLLSDGQPNSQSAVYTKVSTAIQKGIKIYTLGLGYGVNGPFMQDIANKTGGTYKFSPTPQELNAMMTDLAGEIFDTAGKNVVLESTLPLNGMTVDTTKIAPSPSSITNNTDGTKTLKWSLDKLVMGQEKLFEINYNGTNLVSDTEILLTRNTKLSYLDKNNTPVTVNLPDLKIPVNKYMLDSKVTTDKASYTADEEVNITNTANNLTSYPSTLIGKVEITDTNGNVVNLFTDNVTNTWSAGEIKTMDFTWNTSKTLTGTYKVRVTWSEGEKVISIAETSFSIVADKAVTSSVTVEKQRYTADEEVQINEKVHNDSTNNIENGLSVKTSIKNSDGNVIWSSDNVLPELLPTTQTSVKNSWNTAKNAPGQYVVTMEVYRGDTKLTDSSTIFEIVSETEGVTGVSGSLQVLQKNVYPADAVNFKYTMNNTGNVKLTDITARIRIVDTATEEVVGTITDQTNIDVSSSYTAEKAWTHEPLRTGVYLVVLDALLSNGTEVPLGSGYIKVGKPYETTINQVIRPRVLVWAETQSNIELAKKVLDGMQVFYKTVNTREAFMAELRTNKYNLYMLLDSSLPLSGSDDRELAAELAMGKGMVASRGADGDNLKNLGLFGVQFSGSTAPDDFTVNFAADSIFGQQMLTGTGKVQNVRLDGGLQLSTLNSKAGIIPGVVSNTYQGGRSILFTFDIGSCTGDTESILKKAVEFTTPLDETNNGYVELEIKAKANTAIGAEIKLNIPQDSEIIWLSPDENAWSFEMATGQEYLFRVILKLPQTAGQYPVTVDSYYSTSSGMLKFDTAGVKVIRIQ
jgi:Mg-chelatase subunit ChlD